MKCRAVIPGAVDCSNAASFRVAFKDGDKIPACRDCALRLGELAKSFGTTIGIEPLVLTAVETGR